MKKFLFTLAALMMAGSAFANEYFYLADFEVPQSALGASGAAARINVDVKAHFDNWVSAWQVDFILPEGLTIQGHRPGSDLTLTGLDDFGDPKTFTPNLKVNADKTRVIVACDEAGYDEDGNQYGAMKWAPGNYDQMWIVVFNATADFKGGEVIMTTQPACGNDTRPEVTPCVTPEVPYQSEPTTVTVEGATPQPTAFVGTANVEFVGSVAQLSYTSNDPNATVVVTCDDKEVEVNWVENDGTYTATYNVEESTELGNHSSVVTLTVTPDGENFVGEAASDNATYSYTVTEDFDADVEVVFNGNVASLTYVANDEDAVPTVYVNGVVTPVEWNNGEATYTVTENTAPGTYNVTVELSVAPGNQFIIGDPISDSATYTYTVLETTATPVITEVERHHNWVKFHVEGNGTLTVLVDGTPVQLDAEGNYIVYASTVEDVTYVVVATAKEDGKYESAPAQMNITIAKWDGVDELVNGKTVAGVRYFNMAGQEMQEANGMTIVVTTYTDGTTSAVKVMK